MSASPFIFVHALTSRQDIPVNAMAHYVVSTSVEGFHAFWAATVPYIPEIRQSEQEISTFGIGGTGRVRAFFKRQQNLLYALANMQTTFDQQSMANHTSVTSTNTADTYQPTFEMRYITIPRPSQSPIIRLVILGKVFATSPGLARNLATIQWERFRGSYPGEPPYSYPLEPVVQEFDADGLPAWERSSFSFYFSPISDRELDAHPGSIVEIVKHEDIPPIRVIDTTRIIEDYLPQPLIPPEDYVSMANLLRSLMEQTVITFVGITIRPIRLCHGEMMHMARLLRWYNDCKDGREKITNSLAEESKQYGLAEHEVYLRSRAKLGSLVYDNFIKEERTLFQFAIHVVTAGNFAPALVDAVRSELSANINSDFPCTTDVRIPHQGVETQWARFNLNFLELERWHVEPTLLQRTPYFARLRYIATIAEIIAGFRLPTAPADGNLFGLQEGRTLPALGPHRAEQNEE